MCVGGYLKGEVVGYKKQVDVDVDMEREERMLCWESKRSRSSCCAWAGGIAPP